MRILLTGISSFTGYWFAKELIHLGYQVTAPIRKSLNEYEGLRKERLLTLQKSCEIIENCPFHSDKFYQLIKDFSFDVFCHHAADVTNYKSPDFDPIQALDNNAKGLKKILEILKENKCNRLVLTGSVFETGEGAGSDHLRAVSPYGLSKALTSEVFKYYCEEKKFRLGKFVIPNPFGPFEEFRFTSFLIKNWYENKTVTVSQPSYVRDNIHVSLLAKAYGHFVTHLSDQPGFEKLNPSHYPESQGAFTHRFAEAMRKRLLLPCSIVLGKQTAFPEPKVRINTDLLDFDLLQWDEDKAWDDLAYYYQTQFSLVAV